MESGNWAECAISFSLAALVNAKTFYQIEIINAKNSVSVCLTTFFFCFTFPPNSLLRIPLGITIFSSHIFPSLCRPQRIRHQLCLRPPACGKMVSEKKIINQGPLPCCSSYSRLIPSVFQAKTGTARRKLSGPMPV